jgi:hypothetical protein
MKPKEKKPKKKTEITTADITFIGGTLDKRTLRFIHPTPQYLVMHKGTELYKRLDPTGVVDANYQHTTNWEEYTPSKEPF